MRKASLIYAIILGAYDIVFASVWAYVTVYLLAKDLNEFQIGILIAMANILAVVIQPYLANQADKSVRWTLYHYLLLLFFPALFLLSLVWLVNVNQIMTGIAYLLAITLFTAASPLLNSMAMLLVNNGYPINYGMCRSVGSLSFGITTSLVGAAIIIFGNNSIIIVGMAGIIILLFALSYLNKFYFQPIFTEDYQEVKYNTSRIALENSNKNFFKKYPHFFYLLIGSLLLFISQNIISYYLINIVSEVGGNEADMGLALSVAAFAEVPAMFFYLKFANKFGHEKMLLISTIFFWVRIFLMFMATSMGGIYFAQLMQSGGYGFYIIASVYYPNEIMHNLDKVKGQAFLTTAGTLGGVLGSSLGGIITKSISINAALLFGLICSSLGLIAYFYGLLWNKISAS